MNSKQIRQTFLDFFKSKGHQIVPSAPMVIKNDPTLMFTNAGMNQFKDIFLGNSPVLHPRIADTQKCLRVSGKHNDLEEVGLDTYHHTMFEMLGNWSFGDYFKEDAIAWAWELLTDVYKIDVSRLYVTVFEGDASENLEFDTESYNCWKKYIAEDRILRGNKKDNFWEMGDTGPCGPCTEIHVDIRSDAERANVDGKDLVNQGHPQVIEIWNNVFIQFNRSADRSLSLLPAKHVDTGMGFERLCMVLQGKTSNYDTDVFTPYIFEMENITGKSYGASEKTDIAFRVIADHIRAVTLAIADGQLPSNNGAGYVIRRILRRAIRYGYSYLEMNTPFIYRLVDILCDSMGETFPELIKQKDLAQKVILEEETSFLRTIGNGLNKLVDLMKNAQSGTISGKEAFELYDTYGFPIDLTRLVAQEEGYAVDEDEFNRALQEQKDRSRKAAEVKAGDWIEIRPYVQPVFFGYDELEGNCNILRYRKVQAKGKDQYHIVLDRTPFYAESGGQLGDSGRIGNINESIVISNTIRENDLIIHIANDIPQNPNTSFTAKVDTLRRNLTANNHSATHLLHAALRTVLGTHVEQRGSLVSPDYLRFDFSHHSKVTDQELSAIEHLVNRKIRENIRKTEERNVPVQEAINKGAMALFGEKYGDSVRVITFDPEYSVELCGGTHVDSTGSIGFFKITSEGSVAAGIRRIEAITADKAELFIYEEFNVLNEIRQSLKTAGNPMKNIQALVNKNAELEKEIEKYKHAEASRTLESLLEKKINKNGIDIIASTTKLDADSIRNIAFSLKKSHTALAMLLASEKEGKANISVFLSDDLVENGHNAIQIIKNISSHIQGGGGGQPFLATAGGKNPEGIPNAIRAFEEIW